MTAPLTGSETSAKPMPKLWAKLPIRSGNAIQLAGIAVGTSVLVTAVHLHAVAGVRVGLLAGGWLAIYLCSHAIAHVAVGRIFGIRFRAYGVRGTDHPENYPPGVRQVMSALPMWSALTDRDSMRQAKPWAKAAMFSAGETSTTIMSIASAAYAAHAGIPGGHALLTGSILWALAATVTVAVVANGDNTKAMRALGWRKPTAAKTAPVTRERTTGPNRRGPRSNELRNAVIGWTLVNLALIIVWAAHGAGFPWFAFVTVPSVIGVSSWARQGRREAVTR